MTLRRSFVLRAAILIAAIVAGAALVRASGLCPEATREGLLQFQQRLRESGIWGPLLYVILCAAGAILFVPAIPLILPGALFGVAQGTLYAFVGLSLGAAASFLLSRHAFRPLVERLIMHRPAFLRLDEGVRREGWHMVLITRLLPVFPFCAQNYAFGVTAIGFWPFLLVSCLCILPAIAAYIFVGATLLSGREHAGRTVLYLIIGATTFGLLYLAMRIARRSWRAPAGDPAEQPTALAKKTPAGEPAGAATRDIASASTDHPS